MGIGGNRHLLYFLSNCSAMSILMEFKCLFCQFEGASAIEKSIVLPRNICIERANVVDIDVAVWLRHECRVTDWLR